ncbi:MAG TPA: hypothetical protein VJP41_05585 [Gaiellaceae bacterium]|nr:hypothetical protein [Gaiellaceae bacterium]
MTTDDYVRMVAFELRDLPWRTQRELVSELQGHISELPSGTDPYARLGRPHEYAADLRAAAGLERRRGALAFLRARRPRNLAAAAIALTVTGLAVGAVVWINRYQPLVFGNGTANPAHVVFTRTGGAYAIVRTGRPFRYGITVRNDGRFTVRVLGVRSLYGYPFRAHLWASGPTKNGGMPEPERLFHPIDLRPGRTLALYLVGRYACTVQMPAGSSTTLGALPVRFHFLWRNVTTTIDPGNGNELTLLLPKHVGCPPNSQPPMSMP